MKELRICTKCTEERWVQPTCPQRTGLCRRCFDGLSYKDGYAKGLKEGLELRDKELEKQIKLLQWYIKELGQQLQIKSDLFGV